MQTLSSHWKAKDVLFLFDAFHVVEKPMSSLI